MESTTIMRCGMCEHRWNARAPVVDPARCPSCGSDEIETEEVAVMHYGEIFKVREIAYATTDNAEHLGLKPGQMYFVIN